MIIVNSLTSSKLCVEIQDEKYHPCPSMNCVIIDNILASPPTQTCSYFVLYLVFPAIQLMLSSTAEYYHL